MTQLDKRQMIRDVHNLLLAVAELQARLIEAETVIGHLQTDLENRQGMPYQRTRQEGE